MSKSEVLGTSSYLEIARENYEEMFGSELPQRDRLYLMNDRISKQVQSKAIALGKSFGIDTKF